MWQRLNLTRKIALILIVGLCVVFAGFGLTSMWAIGQSTQRSLQERLLLAGVAAKSIDGFNQQASEGLARFAASVVPLLKHGDTAGMEHLLDDARSSLSAREMLLLGADGKVLAVQPSTAQAPTNLGSDDNVSKVYLTASPLISGIETSFIDGRPVVHYMAPAMDQGALEGVIIASIDPTTSSFGAFIDAIELGQTGYAQVVDGKGELLASTQPKEVFGQSDHGGRFVTLIQDQKAVVRTCHNCHEPEGSGSKRRDVMAFAPLSTASWGVAIRQSEAEALQPARRLRLAIIIVGSASLIFTVTYATILTRRHLRPIFSLTESARHIASGDLSQPVTVQGKDEIGTLASTFETMRASMAASRRQLEDRARAIEQHNLELSALNAIAGAASQSLDLQHNLRATLDEVLAATEHSSAGIILKDTTDAWLAPASADPLTREQIAALLQWHRDGARDASSLQTGKLPVGNGPDAKAMPFISVPLHTRGWLILFGEKAAQSDRREQDLLIAIGHQIGVAIDNARLYEQVQIKEEQRGQLLDRVISVQEDERKRIARELHDDSAQALTALAMHLEAVENQLPPQLGMVRESVAKDRLLALRILEDIRRLIADLRPSALDDLGFTSAVRWYATTRLEQQGVNVTVESSQSTFRLPLHLETTLFRVVQEAVNNIAKHANCSEAKISLHSTGSGVRLTIEDNGAGFDPRDVIESNNGRTGFGLLGIRERVALLGGTVSIDSRPNGGTRITVEVPLGKPAPGR